MSKILIYSGQMALDLVCVQDTLVLLQPLN